MSYVYRRSKFYVVVAELQKFGKEIWAMFTHESFWVDIFGGSVCWKLVAVNMKIALITIHPLMGFMNAMGISF